MDINVKKLAEQSNIIIPEEKEREVLYKLSAILQVLNHFPEDVPAVPLLADRSQIMSLRPDEVGLLQNGLTREQALSNAPQKQAGCFVVPTVVRED